MKVSKTFLIGENMKSEMLGINYTENSGGPEGSASSDIFDKAQKYSEKNTLKKLLIIERKLRL